MSLRSRGWQVNKKRHNVKKNFKASEKGLTNWVWEFITKYVQMACNCNDFHLFCHFLRLSDAVHDSQAQFCVLKSHFKWNYCGEWASANFFSKLGPRTHPSSLATSFVAFDKAIALLNFAPCNYLPTVTLIQCWWVLPMMLVTLFDWQHPPPSIFSCFLYIGCYLCDVHSNSVGWLSLHCRQRTCPSALMVRLSGF